MSVEIGDEGVKDIEALRIEMDGLRLLRLALTVLYSHMLPGLASDGFHTELEALTRRVEAKEREVLQTVITVPLLNHTGMDVIAALRVLSENGLSVVLV